MEKVEAASTSTGAVRLGEAGAVLAQSGEVSNGAWGAAHGEGGWGEV